MLDTLQYEFHWENVVIDGKLLNNWTCLAGRAFLISCASNDDHQLVSIVAQMTWNINMNEREKEKRLQAESAAPKHPPSSILKNSITHEKETSTTV